MNFEQKYQHTLGRRLLDYIPVGWWGIISTPLRRPIRIWLMGGVVIVIVVASFLMVPQTLAINAAPEPKPPLECLSCHPKTLEGHDKLGSGNNACWVCHDSTDMKMLHLADGTQLPLSDSPQLCSQCHQKRYEAWVEGTHGIPAWKEGEPGFPGAIKATCTTCHNPHQPQIALLGITKPHPPVQPPPAQPSVALLVMLGVVLVLITGVGAAVVRKGE